MNRVVRYREVGSRLAEGVVLLDNIPAANIHDGGRIRFGPGGLLYITAGDAANTSRAQDLGSLAGKILRITRDGSTPQRRVLSQERLLDGTFGRIRDVVAGPDGYLYLCTSNRDGRGNPTATDDRIVRLVPEP